MKRLIVLLFLFASLAPMAQMKVTVTPTGTYIWCFRDSVGYTANITGTDTSGVTYRWQKNGMDITGADSSLLVFKHVKPSDTGQYRCIATKWAMTDTSNIVILKMHPVIKIDTLYRYNQLSCPLQCKGQFKVLVSGGVPFKSYPPYIYNWHGGHSQDTLCFGLCPGKHLLSISDTTGCVLDTVFFVDVLKAPKIRYTFKPGDTIYLTKPAATLSFPDTATKYMASWKWYMYYNIDSTVTTSNVNPVTYTYDRSGWMLTMLKFRDLNGCDTAITDTLTVKIIDLFIPNVMTPNNPNDKLIMKQTVSKEDKNYQDITLSDVYLSNELVIYDRWGRKVYDQSNYVNGMWDGGKLGDGTYFYVFTGHGQYGDEIHHGSITIFR